MNGYFFDQAGDQRMEKQNGVNWMALIRLIHNAALERDPKDRPSLPNKAWDILDVGCHTGGLLYLLSKEFRYLGDDRLVATSLTGVEPLEYGLIEARRRLPKTNFLRHIEEVPDQSMDVIVSHEALYLVSDLTDWIKTLKRILRPDGGAFIALGSHSENTAWLRWRRELKKKYGHVSYIHKPMNILQTGTETGFDMELHRLHPEPQTSLRFSPPEDGWGEFISTKEAFNFQQQKYVFVFYPKR